MTIFHTYAVDENLMKDTIVVNAFICDQDSVPLLQCNTLKLKKKRRKLVFFKLMVKGDDISAFGSLGLTTFPAEATIKDQSASIEIPYPSHTYDLFNNLLGGNVGFRSFQYKKSSGIWLFTEDEEILKSKQ
jgi:hypothetical protein